MTRVRGAVGEHRTRRPFPNSLSGPPVGLSREYPRVMHVGDFRCHSRMLVQSLLSDKLELRSPAAPNIYRLMRQP